MNNLKEYLMKLGLSDAQSKVMLALYAKQDVDAKVLSADSGIAHTKIYALLDDLESKGLLTKTMGTPMLYRPIEAASLVELLLKKQKETVTDLEELKKSQLIELKDLQKEGLGTRQDQEKVRVVNSREGVWNIIDEVARGAKKEVHFVGNAPAWYEAWEFKESMIAWWECVVTRKVHLKEIMPSDMNFRKPIQLGFKHGWFPERDWMAYLQSPHLEQRKLDKKKTPSCIGIRDREEVVLGMFVPNVSYMGVVISDPTYVEDTLRLFETIWEQAEPCVEESISVAVDELKKMGVLK